MQEIEFILYVSDKPRAKMFYEHVLDLSPVLDMPGMTEFKLAENVKLGLMPETSITKILKDRTPNPHDGTGIPRCEIYLLVDHPDQYCRRAMEAGATPVSSYQEREWGDMATYVADPDGHILAFAKHIR